MGRLRVLRITHVSSSRVCVCRVCATQADSILEVEERLQASGIQHKKTVFVEDGFKVSQVGLHPSPRAPSTAETPPRHWS